MWQYACGDIIVDYIDCLRIPNGSSLKPWNMNLMVAVPEKNVLVIACSSSLYIYPMPVEWGLNHMPRCLQKVDLTNTITRIELNKDISFCLLVTLVSESMLTIYLTGDCTRAEDVLMNEYKTEDSCWGCCGTDEWVAASSNDWNIRAWGCSRASSNVIFKGHGNNVPAVDIYKWFLASASIDGTMRFHDLETQTELAVFWGKGWGWTVNIIDADCLRPVMVKNPKKEFTVKKLAVDNLKEMAPTTPELLLDFFFDDDIDDDDDDDVGPRVPSDEMIEYSGDSLHETQERVDDTADVETERHSSNSISPEDDPIENEEMEDQLEDQVESGELGFTMHFGDNEYAGVWEIAVNQDNYGEDEEEDGWSGVAENGGYSIGEPERRDRDDEFDSFAEDDDEEYQEEEEDYDDWEEELAREEEETRKEHFETLLSDENLYVAYGTNHDFYLLQPDVQNHCFTIKKHLPRLLYATVSPDQRSLMMNRTLTWAMDRFAFSVYIMDVSCILLVNQMGFVCVIRVCEDGEMFVLTIPRGDHVIMPIVGVTYFRLINNPNPVYMIFVLRLNGLLERYILRMLV